MELSVIGFRKYGQFVKLPDFLEHKTFRDAICEAIDHELLQKLRAGWKNSNVEELECRAY